VIDAAIQVQLKTANPRASGTKPGPGTP
jgi:hypothetical protein